jgi:hypothetical protein
MAGVMAYSLSLDLVDQVVGAGTARLGGDRIRCADPGLTGDHAAGAGRVVRCLCLLGGREVHRLVKF